MSSNYSEWDEFYRNYPLEELGWELGKPRPILVEYVESGLIPKGKALDTCCGAGTNPIYLAQKGFDVSAFDISMTALGIANEKAKRLGKSIDFLNGNFVNLPFRASIFDFVFDMGCFHHVSREVRAKFIVGINRVLRKGGVYMLTAFSYRNGAGWNHFTRQQLIDLFSDKFKLIKFSHYPSVEGDGVTRFFYTILMEKP
jgi:SAM-dependent methyltransferase